MATRTKSFPLLRGNWREITLYEAASQTFVDGDLLQLASGGGQVSICATTGNDFDSQASKRFAGIAVQDASGVTDAAIKVLIPADNSAEMLLPVEHATPASAVTAKNLVGDVYVLTNISASEGWGVAIDSASNPTVKIMEIDPTYAIGELNGPVWVRPVYSAEFAI